LLLRRLVLLATCQESKAASEKENKAANFFHSD
jgi:hypothetical protein